MLREYWNKALLSETDATAFNVYISGVGHFTLTDLALSIQYSLVFLTARNQPLTVNTLLGP